MSTETNFLKLHKWILPGDNQENFNYKKSIADAYDIIDEFAENSDSRMTNIDSKLQQVEEKHKKEIEELENLIPTRRSTRRRHYFKR